LACFFFDFLFVLFVFCFFFVFFLSDIMCFVINFG
jgi:hypothetical protein